MTPRDYYYTLEECQRRTLAGRIGIKQDYLRKIMAGHRRPSAPLARTLAKETPYRETHWRPDVFGELAA